MSPRLEVDLTRFRANIDTIRARVAPAELMLVVKDDAYGHGIPALVPSAVAAGVRWIGAFDVETAAAVRAAAEDADLRIFVWMLPTAADVSRAIALDLDLGIGDRALLEDVAQVARVAGVPVRVHLKIDTGLHRNGFRPEEWDAALHRARELEQDGILAVTGVWSHISEASDADDDEARVAYEDALARARAAGLRPAWRHLAASSASSARPDFRYDLVRVGAFAYGVAPAGGPTAEILGVQPIGRLVARVVRTTATRVIVDAGSLHGLPSALAGRARVGGSTGTHRLVSVGLFTSEIEAADLSVGDEVTVYGDGRDGSLGATGLAEQIGTIGEEIVTRLSPRVPRVYLP